MCLLAGAEIKCGETYSYIEDLHTKGLLDQTLVVLATEFGRSAALPGSTTMTGGINTMRWLLAGCTTT